MSDRVRTDPKATFDERLTTALNYHQQGDLKQAKRLYEEILLGDVNNVSALHLSGILAGQEGDYARAQTYIERALILEPNVPSFHNNLANALKHQGRVGDAIFHYKKALELEPGNAPANNNLGILHYQNQQYPEAISSYEAALRIKPDYMDAHYHLGMALLHVNQTETAISHFEQVLSLDPKHTEAYYQLGQVHHQKNNLDQAVDYYIACLGLDPQHVESCHGLAAAYTNLGDLKKAREHFEKTLQYQADHHEARFNFASLLLNQKKLNEALMHYLYLLEHQPNLDVYYNIGVIYMDQDRHDDAIQYFNEALAFDPDHLETHMNMAAVFLKKEDYPSANKHYEIAFKQQPDNPEIAYILNAINQNEKTGKTFNTAPDQYVKNLFDQYAPHFDKHLTEYLYYQAPEQLHKVVTNLLGRVAEEWHVLDLGCGTGLCGPLFRPLAKKLMGVDISEKMLDIAREKSIYDKLQALEMVTALRDYNDLDLIIAVDVLPYVGDLKDLFGGVGRALKPQGWFAFTIEKTSVSPYELQRSARFAHAQDYIEQLAAKYNFDILHSSSAILRNNRNQVVEGAIYVLSSL